MPASPQNPTASTARFQGCFTAVITPFTSDGAQIDYTRLESQIAAQAAGGVTGVVLCGTTGESPTLEEHEYEELVRRGIAMCRSHKLMAIVGTGSNSTAHAVKMHRFAAAAGADGSLSVNPYYNKPTQEGLYRHFMAVADAASLPVMLYNIPGRTGVALTTETIVRLSSNPNIRAVKDATGGVDQASEVASRCPELAVFSGDDPLTLPMMAVGAVGVVSVVSNIVPGEVARLCKSFADGRGAEALAIHRKIAGLTRSLFVETNPIPVKAAMALLGRDTGAVRLPLCPATPATLDRLRTELGALELLGSSKSRPN